MVRWKYFALSLTIAAAVPLSACNDSTGATFEPIIVTDTFEVAAPLSQNASLPTAIDVTNDGLGSVKGGRFPERPADAGLWDFAVRIRDGRLSFVTARRIGLSVNSAITGALSGETFEGLVEAPPGSAFSADTTVAILQGGVYGVRSRETSGGLFGSCVTYAKLQPLAVDQALGRATVRVTSNLQCNDIRLDDE